MMTDPRFAEAVEGVEFFYSKLKSIDDYNELEVKGVVMGVLTPTLTEECLIAIFFRASSNVKTLLDLKDVKHFQAMGMLARGLYELAVDIKLMEVDTTAALKMIHFKDVEKLRACETMVTFRKASGGIYCKDTAIQEAFIEKEATRIRTVALTIWPGKELSALVHWSAKNLASRIKILDHDLQEMYACFYRQLSWNVHAGVQGVHGLKPETFAHMCSMSYDLAARICEMILISVIKVFKLEKHDPLIHKKLELARYLPLTESAQDEAILRYELGL